MKEKHKKGDNRFDSRLAEAYTFVGIEADTKLVLCFPSSKSVHQKYLHTLVF